VRFSSSESLSVVCINAANAGPIVIIGIHRKINKRFKEAKYGLVEVEVGEDFDPVNQVDLSQNSRGKVTEYVFYGYGFLKEKEVSNEEDVITRIIKMPLVLTV